MNQKLITVYVGNLRCSWGVGATFFVSEVEEEREKFLPENRLKYIDEAL